MGPTASQLDPSDPKRSELRELWPAARRFVEVVGEILGLDPANCGHVGPSHLDEATLQALAVLTELHETSAVPSTTALGRGYVGVGQPLEELATDADERTRLRSIFEDYKRCNVPFRHKQWKVICLRYRDGLTQAEIAARLHLGRSAVSRRLGRARKEIQAHHCELREQAFLAAAKNVKE